MKRGFRIGSDLKVCVGKGVLLDELSWGEVGVFVVFREEG